MKQIKTVCQQGAEDFDKEVNEALADGWTLVRRYRSHTDHAFIAELEKETITESERCCENCAHCDNPGHVLPCKVCIDASHWEEE